MTDLPDAEAARQAWLRWFKDQRWQDLTDVRRDAFLAGFAAAHGDVSVNKGQSDTIPDAVVELTDDERKRLRDALRNTPLPATMPADYHYLKQRVLPVMEAAVESIVAARLAAASGPWAEHLDAANAERDEQREIAEWNGWACNKNQELFRQAEAERDAALARNAELEADLLDMTKTASEYNDLANSANADWSKELERADALRAELDNLRGRVTALADECDVRQMGEKVERENAHRAKKGSTDEFFHYGKQRAWGEARNLIRAAIVRGSDDEAGEDE